MIARIFRRAQQALTHVIRDRRGLPSLLVPIGLLLLMGWMMKGSEVDVTIAIVPEGDHFAVGEIVAEMEDTFAANDVGSVQLPDVASAERALRDGDADGYIVVDEGFAGVVLGGEEGIIRTGVIGDNAAVKDAAEREVRRALILAPLRALRASTGGGPVTDGDAFELETAYVYGGADFDRFDQLLPALLAFLVFLTVFTSSLVYIANDRGLHTLERAIATPLRRWEYVTGGMLNYLLISLLQAVTVLFAAVYILDVNYAGSEAAILAVTAVVALCGVSISVFFGAFARSESEAMSLLPVPLIPQFIICGVLFPVSAMPEALQQVARFLPVTYAVEALREVMLRGSSLTDPSVLTNLAVLVAFSASFAALGIRALQPEEQ
jgi:ABC-2 type transport system permease protein